MALEAVNRRLEEVAKAVGGGYCRLQMPLKLALGVRETVAGHRLGAREGGGGTSPPSNAFLTEGFSRFPSMWRALRIVCMARADLWCVSGLKSFGSLFVATPFGAASGSCRV